MTTVSQMLAMLPTLWAALMARARPLLASLRDSLSAAASKWRATPAATKRKWLTYAAAAVAAAALAAVMPWLVSELSKLTAPPAHRQTQDVFDEAVRAAQQSGYSASANVQVKPSSSSFTIKRLISRGLCRTRLFVVLRSTSHMDPQHVNQKAVRNSTHVLESQLLQCAVLLVHAVHLNNHGAWVPCLTRNLTIEAEQLQMGAIVLHSIPSRPWRTTCAASARRSPRV